MPRRARSTGHRRRKSTTRCYEMPSCQFGIFGAVYTSSLRLADMIIDKACAFLRQLKSSHREQERAGKANQGEKGSTPDEHVALRVPVHKLQRTSRTDVCRQELRRRGERRRNESEHTDAALVARKDWQTAAVVPDKNGRMFDCGGPLKSSSLDRFCETVARSRRACQHSGEHRRASRFRRTASLDNLFIRDRQTADDESEYDPDCTSPHHAVLCEVAVHDVATKQEQKAADEHAIGEQAGDILQEAVLSARLQSGLGQMRHSLEPKSRSPPPGVQSLPVCPPVRPSPLSAVDPCCIPQRESVPQEMRRGERD